MCNIHKNKFVPARVIDKFNGRCHNEAKIKKKIFSFFVRPRRKKLSVAKISGKES